MTPVGIMWDISGKKFHFS